MPAEQIIRDPVHDVIAFRLDKSSDALLFRLLAAAEVQRLRRIRQLGMASLAYPGADHSRYSHSLGVMETARRILEQLARSFYIPEADQLVCVVAALLHDLGHGPFSHVFERITGIHHETVTHRIILDPQSAVNRLLSVHDRALPQRVVDLLTCRPRRAFFCDILSSQLDADRLDYLLRDNLMTGSQYGAYDLNWLLHAFTIDEPSGRLAIAAKGVSAVEAYLQSRFHMYRNVYFHKVVRSAEGMVRLALQRARELASQDRLDHPPRGSPLHKALLGQELSTAEFTDLDDISMTQALKLWSAGSDAILAELCHGLLFRELFKAIDLSRIEDPAEARLVAQAVEHAISAAGGEAPYEFFYDEPSETAYQSDATSHPADEQILVREDDGKLRDLASVSPITGAMERQLMFRRIHVAPRWRDLASQTVARLR
jgi:HD superfamily phosphohydrolase